MAPPMVLNIEFENKVGYYPGSTVKGQVEMILKKKLQIKAISIYAKGVSEVRFKKFVFPPGKFVNVSDDEEFYTKVVPLYGNNLGSLSHNFMKGTYRYSFSYSLSDDIPFSFESKSGYIRHFCKAVVEIDNQNFDNIDFTILYNVLPLLDLNLEQSARSKIQYTGEKNVWFLCGKAGFISAILNIDKSGFCPSENIIINAECTNGSNRPIITKAELYQIITYRGNGQEKKSRKLITFLVHPEIGPGNDDIWFDEKILVPQLPPSELRGCRLIDIQYKIKFQLRPSGLASRLNVSFPIMIGTKPVLIQSDAPQESMNTSPMNPYFADSSPTAPPIDGPRQHPPSQKVVNISLTSTDNANATTDNSLSIQY